TSALEDMAASDTVQLDYALQRAWRDVAEYGPSLHNPVLDYEGSEYRLQKLRRLPPESFSRAGATYSTIKNRILPGICLNTTSNQVEYWQSQSSGGVKKIENVFMITDPLSGELGGTPFIVPIVPIVTMLNFSWQGQLQKVNRFGAGGIFFLKVTNPKGDDRQYAQTILRNMEKNTAFQLRENMEVVNLGINESGSALETITELGMQIRQFFSPASLISKDGTLIGGSSGPEFELYMAYVGGTQRWLERACRRLLNPWLVANGYAPRYRIAVDIPSPTVDKSELLINLAKAGYETRSMSTNERREVLALAGAPLKPLDEEGLETLEHEYEGAAPLSPLMQKAETVAKVMNADPLDPYSVVDKKTAKEVVNAALGVSSTKEEDPGA
ncbi:MAG: hypothetical protein PHI56_09710, partial [Victivallaceae bacterium]|nr:hypothetical protein [Victivallaceae bacterium]